MNPFIKSVAVAVTACLPFVPLAAHAAKPFLLPSATILSGSDHWVAVDAAVADDLFMFEHPLKLDAVTAVAPDGSPVALENTSTGKVRSTFELHLVQQGTYKITLLNDGLFASWKENGQVKRWRGEPANFAKEVPAGATDLQVTEMGGRIETYVTVGKPSDRAFSTAGNGLELVPVTHPNDVGAGQPATFKVLLDGKPAAGTRVTAIPGGSRYRDQLNDMSGTTDANGQFAMTFPQPGMYWISVSAQDDNAKIKGARRRLTYAITLEVQP